MKKSKKVILLTSFLLFLGIINLTSADMVSINSGGSNQTIINPNQYIEGFFFKSPNTTSSEDSSGGGSSGGGGGGGSTPTEPENETNETENKTKESFKLNKDRIEVSLEKNESAERCFKTINLKDKAIFNINTKIEGEIKNYTNISKKNFNLMPEISEEICMEFSSAKTKSGNSYEGTVSVSKNQTKTIEIILNIVKKKDKKIEGRGGSTNKYGDDDDERPINKIIDSIPDELKGIETLILWLPLLIAIIIFLVIKKYTQFMSSISGKKTREEKLAEVERMKRKSQRSKNNFFERLINKAAISLASKTVSNKKGKTKKKNKQIKRRPKKDYLPRR